MATYEWRVNFEHRQEYVLADELHNAVKVAMSRVRKQDGELKSVELYTHGENNPWGTVYVSPKNTNTASKTSTGQPDTDEE